VWNQRRDRTLQGLRIEIKIDGTMQKKRGHLPKDGLISCFFFPTGRHFFDGEEEMTDQQLALQAINEAQLILEEYLRPRPQNNEHILDKLVDCYALTSWDAKRAGQTTLQRRSAIKSGRALVVLSSYRWTKVLVRRQAHAFEIVVGMAQEGIRAIRFQQTS
jgi:hypothetical protein